MTTDLGLNPRHVLIDTLCGDLNAQGWDQPNKLYLVQGVDGDEWLAFEGEFTGPPENRLVELLKANTVTDETRGVVVVAEGWAYPARLAKTFTSAASLRSYQRLQPPSDHPDRVEIRQLISVHRDGEVIGLTYRKEGEGVREWAHLPADAPSPTGDKTVDAARALLGHNPALAESMRQTREVPEQIRKVTEAMNEALSGKVSREEATLRMFNALPEEMRTKLVGSMSEALKREMRALLSEEEQRRYGL